MFSFLENFEYHSYITKISYQSAQNFTETFHHDGFSTGHKILVSIRKLVKHFQKFIIFYFIYSISLKDGQAVPYIWRLHASLITAEPRAPSQMTFYETSGQRNEYGRAFSYSFFVCPLTVIILQLPHIVLSPSQQCEIALTSRQRSLGWRSGGIICDMASQITFKEICISLDSVCRGNFSVN